MTKPIQTTAEVGQQRAEDVKKRTPKVTALFKKIMEENPGISLPESIKLLKAAVRGDEEASREMFNFWIDIHMAAGRGIVQ